MRSPTKTETKEKWLAAHKVGTVFLSLAPSLVKAFVVVVLVFPQNQIKSHLVDLDSDLVLLENTQKALPDLARLLAGVNTAPDSGGLVVLADGGGLSVVGSQTLGQGVGVVVGALDQGLAGDIVGHVALGGVEDLVVRAAGGGVDETASDTGNEEGVVDLQLNGVLELLLAGEKHLVQTLGLGDSSGETVQDETVDAR